jgi:hypothetical protein
LRSWSFIRGREMSRLRIHEWEHELYYLLEGRMDFYCENEILSIGAGEVAFLPQGKAHAFYIRPPVVRALISVQATGERAVGLDRYFIDMGEPAASMELPDHQATHVMSDPAHAIRVAAAHGIRILSPEETAELLPHIPVSGLIEAWSRVPIAATAENRTFPRAGALLRKRAWPLAF